MNINYINNLLCNKLFIYINLNLIKEENYLIHKLQVNNYIKSYNTDNLINNIKIKTIDNNENIYNDLSNSINKYFLIENNSLRITNINGFTNHLKNLILVPKSIENFDNLKLEIELNITPTDHVINMRKQINNKLINMKNSRNQLHEKFQIVISILLIIIHFILANVLLTYQQNYITLPNVNSIFGLYLLNHLLIYYIFSNIIKSFLIFTKLDEMYKNLSLILIIYELSNFGLSKIYKNKEFIQHKKITDIAEDVIVPGYDQKGGASIWTANMANTGAIKGSIITSVIMIIIRTIILSINTNIPTFDVMFWIMMIFANVVGFTFDQIFAKEEGFYITNPTLLNGKNIYVNQLHTGLQILDSNNPDLANIIGVESTDNIIPFIDFNKSKSIIVNLSKYIGYNLLSVEFFKFIIIVCIDIAFASFLYNVLKDWMKENGSFPDCYTTSICCKLDKDKKIIKSSCCDNNESIEKCTINKYDIIGESFDKIIDTILQLSLSLITFYLFVNNFRIQWAYNTNIFDKTYISNQLAIIIFGLLTCMGYKLQKTVSNPSFAQTPSFKSMLFCIIIVFAIILEPFIEINKSYSNNSTFNNTKSIIGIVIWCIICIGIPIWKLIPVAKKENSKNEQKCHSNLIKNFIQNNPLNKFEHPHN